MTTDGGRVTAKWYKHHLREQYWRRNKITTNGYENNIGKTMLCLLLTKTLLVKH